jgi:hypothetical protein
MKKLTFSGEYGSSTPIFAASSWMNGSQVDSANSRVCGACWPGSISSLTRTKFISALAMKLNMMVVTTIWLPRFACSQPGRKAQAAPNSSAASTDSGVTIHQGQPPRNRQTSATPRPAKYACPSTPILNRPAWKAIATARPAKTKLVVLYSV